MKQQLQLYADGIKPDKQHIEKLLAQGITGATANPSLVKQYLPMAYEDYSRFLINHFYPHPVSVQVLSSDIDEMYDQAQKISLWGENVYVKIPIVTKEGFGCETLIVNLLNEGIKVNVTALFTPGQVASLMRKGLVYKHDCILSVFCGRIADTGRLPLDTIKEIHGMFNFNTENGVKLLWAGVRSAMDIELARGYCNSITLPQAVLDKLPMRDKDLGEYCAETVEMFARDAENFTI